MMVGASALIFANLATEATAEPYTFDTSASSPILDFRLNGTNVVTITSFLDGYFEIEINTNLAKVKLSK
jgi:hypothetical protein